MSDQTLRTLALQADLIKTQGEEIAALYARTYKTPRPLVERAIAEL